MKVVKYQIRPVGNLELGIPVAADRLVQMAKIYGFKEKRIVKLRDSKDKRFNRLQANGFELLKTWEDPKPHALFLRVVPGDGDLDPFLMVVSSEPADPGPVVRFSATLGKTAENLRSLAQAVKEIDRESLKVYRNSPTVERFFQPA